MSDIEVRRVNGGLGVEPRLDQSWSHLEKLRWLAALVQSETGIKKIQVAESDYKIGDVPQSDYYNISLPRCASGPHTFHGAWEHLNGIEVGAKAVLDGV